MSSNKHYSQNCIGCGLISNSIESPYGICPACSKLTFIDDITPLEIKDYLTLDEKLLFILLILFLGLVLVLFLTSPVEVPFYLDRLS